MDAMHTLLHSDLSGAGLRLPLCRRLFVLLHAPYLIWEISSFEHLDHGHAMLTLIMVCGGKCVAGIKPSQ